MKKKLKYYGLYLLCAFPFLLQAQEGPLLRSVDNGQSWHAWSTGLSTAKRIDRILADSKTLYALSESQGLFRSTDGGKNWRQPGFSMFLPKKIDVLYQEASLLYAGTYQQGVYVSADQGNSWVAMNKGLTDLTVRAFHSEGKGMWVGTNDGLYLWDAAKQRWQHQLRAVQVNAITQVGNQLLVATHEGLQHSTDGGQSWAVALDKGTVKQLYAFEGQIYACSMRKTVWKFNAKNNQWMDVTQDFPTEGYSSSILYLDQEVIYVTQGQQLYRKHKAKKQWEQINVSLSSPLQYRDLKMVQPGVLLLACATK